jgi:arylsulfatase A-like enzyme
MYLHYLAPHAPYDPPAKYRKKFKQEYNGKFFFPGKTAPDYARIRLSPEETDELMARYDGEISYVDHEFGRFVDFLREQNLLQKTLLIVMADHGEALGERGRIGHGFALNTVAQVPLIIFPAPEHRRRIMGDIIGLIDLAPSILGWLGIKAPSDFKGNDISDSRGKAKKEFEFSRSSGNRCQIMRNKTHILKYYKRSKEIKLYDLRTDPFEFKDISKDNPELVKAFISAYNSVNPDRDAIPVGAYAKDKESTEGLRALGYLQ